MTPFRSLLFLVAAAAAVPYLPPLFVQSTSVRCSSGNHSASLPWSPCAVDAGTLHTASENRAWAVTRDGRELHLLNATDGSDLARVDLALGLPLPFPALRWSASKDGKAARVTDETFNGERINLLLFENHTAPTTSVRCSSGRLNRQSCRINHSSCIA